MESPTNRTPTLPFLALRSLRNPACRLRKPLPSSLPILMAGWSAASFLAGGRAARVVGLVAGAAFGGSFAGASSARTAGDRAGASMHAAKADRIRTADHLPGLPGLPDGRTVSV